MAQSIRAAMGVILWFSATGCREYSNRTLISPEVLVTPSLQVAISVSQVDAKVGDRVDVTLTLDTDEDVTVSLVQGTLMFDATTFATRDSSPPMGP